MIELVLVRHGEPRWEPAGRAVDEPELTPLGHEQAGRAAKTLAGETFDAVYTSPLRRAEQTAVPIVEALGVEPIVLPWLSELRLPSLEGSTPEQVQRFFASARGRDPEAQWTGLPGGESFSHFYERVSGGIEGLLVGDHRLGIHHNDGHRIWELPRDEERRLLFVAHAGTNAVLLSHLLGIDPVPWAYIRFESAWASISRIHTTQLASGVIWKLDSFSRTGHLAGLADSSPPESGP